mmetsp:Transcript_18400/g.24283  ORF Transcript_18400/g.24283 Transcript_18400/m.24283 type:complete len:557 (+) Transcript_18400:175-1845(+)
MGNSSNKSAEGQEYAVSEPEGAGSNTQLGWVNIKASLAGRYADMEKVKVQSNKVFSNGLIIQGGAYVPYRQGIDIGSEYEASLERVIPRWYLPDPRATQLLITPTNEAFYVVSAPEVFSRHSGTCRILGDKDHPSELQQLKLGMFLRLGSVGLVISEIHTGESGGQQILKDDELRCLKETAIAMKRRIRNTGPAPTASDNVDNSDADSEASSECLSQSGHGPTTPIMIQCYMCFDGEEEDDNPLVAPCECKGDTRYVHLKCLQRWHVSSNGNQVCVVCNQNGAHVCSVCKSPYKTHVILKNGTRSDLLRPSLNPPYICFTVVTQHQNSDDLFSTKYQLSFDTVLNRHRNQSTRGLVIGRSHNCDMILDYRTVSTHHAVVRYTNGSFFFMDLRSSNGSLLYLREPLELPYGSSIRLRWGRSTISLKATRSWKSQIAQQFVRIRGRHNRNSPEENEDLKFLTDLAAWRTTSPENTENFQVGYSTSPSNPAAMPISLFGPMSNPSTNHNSPHQSSDFLDRAENVHKCNNEVADSNSPEELPPEQQQRAPLDEQPQFQGA